MSPGIFPWRHTIMKKSHATPVASEKLFYTLKETAAMLGLSERQFSLLRDTHPVYAPDGSKSLTPHPKRDTPLWSVELIRLLSFARSFTMQGTRQLTDDEGLKVRQSIGDTRRREYLALIDE